MTTPISGVAAAIKACLAACTISVTPGTYGAADLQKLNPPAVATLDLTGSTFTGRLEIQHSSNLEILNFSGAAADLMLSTVNAVTVVNPHCTATPLDCVVITNGSNGVTVNGGGVLGELGDGVDIAGSSNVTVNGFQCVNPNTSVNIHPDCVQGWPIVPVATATVPAAAPTPLTNILIENNVLYAPPNSFGSQGFDIWNHGDPSLVTNVQIINNTAITPASACLALLGVTNGVAKGNVCVTQPGANSWTTIPYPTMGPGSTITGTTLVDDR
jgi:hypothetical protein